MFKGTTLELGDQEYVIPPLSLEKLEELEPRFHALGTPTGSFSERLKQLMPILLASFQRNYPEITEAQLRSQLDLPALNQLLQIIMTANGFTTAPGNKQPAASAKPHAIRGHDADSGLPTGNGKPATGNGVSPGESTPAKE
jgi:hypothetical protein